LSKLQTNPHRFLVLEQADEKNHDLANPSSPGKQRSPRRWWWYQKYFVKDMEKLFTTHST